MTTVLELLLGLSNLALLTVILIARKRYFSQRDLCRRLALNSGENPNNGVIIFTEAIAPDLRSKLLLIQLPTPRFWNYEATEDIKQFCQAAFMNKQANPSNGLVPYSLMSQPCRQTYFIEGHARLPSLPS